MSTGNVCKHEGACGGRKSGAKSCKTDCAEFSLSVSKQHDVHNVVDSVPVPNDVEKIGGSPCQKSYGCWTEDNLNKPAPVDVCGSSRSQSLSPSSLRILETSTTVLGNDGEKSGNATCHCEVAVRSKSVVACGHKGGCPSPRSTSISSRQVDVESGSSNMERIVLRVHGMDCTSCERKLYNSLKKLPPISNIKTSLLIGQTEFDLHSSESLNGANISDLVGRLTGFSCARILQAGAVLELELEDGNITDYTQGWPNGVTDINVVGILICISYLPTMVGARSLYRDPYFSLTRLSTMDSDVSSGKAYVRGLFWKTIFSTVLTIPVLVLSWAPIPKRDILYGGICVLLATTIQISVAGSFYASALKSLIFSRMIDMDFLVVVSTSAAYMFSIVAYGCNVARRPILSGQFFETCTLLVTLVMVGKTISAYARQRAVNFISFESSQPTIATLVSMSDRCVEETIDARLLQYGDIFRVLPDTLIVTDGMITNGESEVDESLMTGEPTLISKTVGDNVIAGSLNHSSVLYVEVTRLPFENTIRNIAATVDEAKSSKPKVQELADRVASYFVPVILAVTVIVFVTQATLSIHIQHQRRTAACINAMTFAISMLIVSCPCAIGLAVPMVVVIAGGVAARHGLIFKTAETIDTARKVTHVIFDKTGTVTDSNLSIVSKSEWYHDAAAPLIQDIILALTKTSAHPVSRAVAAYMEAKGLCLRPIAFDAIFSIPGNGIQASLNKTTILAGKPSFLNVDQHPLVVVHLAQGHTLFCVSIEGTLSAIFALQSSLRHSALTTVTTLQNRDITISLLSGDNHCAVHSIAAQLNIPVSHVRAHCTPAQKQAYIKTAMLLKNSIILFCGDGTNDAPALAQASIGVHINEGTDLAGTTADVILMTPNLEGILKLIDLSNAFRSRVVFNFVWSGIYNIVALLLAAGVFPGRVRIAPQWAALGEVVSVVPVVLVAMGLKWVKL